MYYFFFRWDESESNLSSYGWRAILAQILESRKHEQSVLDKFSFARTDLSQGQRVASPKALLSLLQLYVSLEERESFIVFDGIDECTDHEEFVSNAYQTLGKVKQVKLLLFSRPNMESLLDRIPPHRQFPVGRATSKDIYQYVARELQGLKEDSRLSASANLQELANRLATGADGMFLWARLMMEFLTKARSLTKRRREETIRNVVRPERLDKMYQRILSQIEDEFEEDKRLAQYVVMWLLYGKHSLTASAMRDSNSQWSTEAGSDFERAVLTSCMGLVEIHQLPRGVPQGEMRGFRFIHQSVEDFLRTFTGNCNPLCTAETEANTQITRTCLEYLIERLPHHSLSGRSGKDAPALDVHQRMPFCYYAAGNWTEHLQLTLTAQSQPHQLCDLISRFLSRPKLLNSWIEVSFLLNKRITYDGLREWSRRLRDSLQHPVLQESLAFCEELDQLVREWRLHLVQSPSCIWLEATAFSLFPHLHPSKDIDITSFLPNGGDIPHSGQYLNKLSGTSQDGLYEAILTVIPSE